MAIQESDIKFYYSSTNSGTESFGGTYSSEITGKFLFSDISQATLADGIIDYRCIYLKNSNQSEYFNDFEISITEYAPSYIEFGFYGVYSSNSTVNITNAVGDGSKVVYTTQSNHGFVAGQSVLVTGITGDILSGYNISATIDSVTSTTFTVTSDATGDYVVESSGGVASQTAIKFVNEEQILTINYLSLPTEGTNSYFYLQYEDQTVKVFWLSNVNNQAAELQTKLRTLNKLDTVEVSYFDGTSFKITIPNQRANDTISIAEVLTINGEPTNPLNLTVSGSVTKLGGPSTGVTRNNSSVLINPAPELPTSQTAPSITFFDITKTLKLTHFYPGDYLAMWIKRTVIAGSTPSDGDGFLINISATGTTVDVTRSPLCPTCPPAETPATTPTEIPTITPTATPFGWTPPPTATATPTATPTTTPTATPFGWTPPPTATATPTATPTATAYYQDGDIVTLTCTTDSPTVEGPGVILGIQNQPNCCEGKPYITRLVMQYKYKSSADEGGVWANSLLYLLDRPRYGNNTAQKIQIGTIDFAAGYISTSNSGLGFLLRAELCSGDVIDQTNSGCSIEGPCFNWVAGSMIWRTGLGDTEQDPMPIQVPCT
jgi:hypothetical protein